MATPIDRVSVHPSDNYSRYQSPLRNVASLGHFYQVDVTTLAEGQGTRYRAELNVKLPGLDTMTPEDVKKTIDTVTTDPATASAH